MKATGGPGNASIELDERTQANVHAGTAGDNLQDAGPANSPHARSDPRASVGKLGRWWSQNISLTLEHNNHGPSGGDPRDYLALERTYLGWFRTSTALVSFGVVNAQLFILRNLDPTKGRIFGATLALGGICISLVGCARYFRQQNLLVQGKTLSGGWHVLIIPTLLGAILLSLFIIILAED